MAVNIGTEVESTDYLRFSAYSIKDLITRKLTEDKQFTDQVYEGSNLAILIDIVSYMYQCLIYNINNAAAESMFSDTQLYENINRLVKFLGYNPKGATAATAEFAMQNTVTDQNKNKYQGQTLYKYSAIDTGLTDKNGKKVYYSLVENSDIPAEVNYTRLFRNGIWKLYQTVFTSSGEEYQTFLLSELKSDASDGKYVQSEYIHVYVQEPGDNVEPEIWKYQDQGVFTNNKLEDGSAIFTRTDKIYNVRLNEDKSYEVSFGNGTNGKIPEKDSKIYIFYLDSNDPTVQLDISQVTGKLKHNPSFFGISKLLYQQIFKVTGNQSIDQGEVYTDCDWRNITISTTTQEEESVDDIRRNAPQWFKTGNRLVTSDDWEYYVANMFKDTIQSVKCQNNWRYIATFFRWLYNIGIKEHNNPKYYLDQNRLTKNFKYSDASDVNNVYLWIKMKNNADIIKDNVNQQVQDIKTLTQQPTYCKPLIVQFAICAEPEASIKSSYFKNSGSRELDPNNYSQLEVTLDNDATYTTNDLRQQIAKIITDFFDESNFTLGCSIDYNKLTQKILSLDSINRIRTIYHNTETGAEEIRNGICFATWTSDFIDLGDDLEVSNSSRTLEEFQFPRLYKSNTVSSKITIIKKAVSSSNIVQY